MSVPVNTEVGYSWRDEYRFLIRFNGNMEANQTSNTTADFRLRGTWTLFIYDVGTTNTVIYPASDYIAFVKGDQDLAAAGYIPTGNAYKHSLPFGLAASSENIITETRVDSYRYGGERNGGTIWNKSTPGIAHTTTPGTYTCDVDEPFSLNLSGSGEQIILRYFASGSSAESIAWINAQSWNTLLKVQDMVDSGDLAFDYRPGERKVAGNWKSHERNDGWAERKNGSWYEMRTGGGERGETGRPPERKINGKWTNQSKLGAM